MKFLSFLLFILFSLSASGEEKQQIFRDGAIINFAPPVVNKDYYLFEYGFTVRKQIKKWKYDYNAFVNASLFEDWHKRGDNLRAGALGFKGGVLFPLPDTPLYYRVAVGFAKTVLHKNPIFGKDQQSVSKKTMVLFEPGFVYKLDHIYFTGTYQLTNVRFFTRNYFFSVGVNY